MDFYAPKEYPDRSRLDTNQALSEKKRFDSEYRFTLIKREKMALSEIDTNARETVKTRSLKRQTGQVNLSK